VEKGEGQWIQVALVQDSSQCKKEVYYRENNHSLEQLSQGCGRVPITGDFQDAVGQSA